MRIRKSKLTAADWITLLFNKLTLLPIRFCIKVPKVIEINPMQGAI